MTRPEIIDRVLAVAAGEIGVEEKPAGSNRGPCEKYGNIPGSPWCAAFVSWVWHEATGAYPTSAGFCRGTLRMLAAARRDGLVRPKGERPERGDIFVLSRGKGHGHTGFVLAVDAIPDKTMRTIEGNVGNQVDVRTRNIKARVLGFIRPRVPEGATP